MNIGKVIDAIPEGILNFGGSLVAAQLSNLIRIDHPVTFNFAVEIEGIIDSGFMEVDGLSDSIQGQSIPMGGILGPGLFYPLQREVGEILLKKGITFEGSLEQWYTKCLTWQKGDPSPLRDVDIIQLQRLPVGVPYIGGSLIEIKRWTYPQCVCNRITYPSFNAMEGSVAVERCYIESTKPQLVPPPTNFGFVGKVIDMLVK